MAVMGWSPHHSPTNTSKFVGILLLYKEKEKKMVNPKATCEDYQGETRLYELGVNRGLGEVGYEGWGQHRGDQHSLLDTRGEVGPKVS